MKKILLGFVCLLLAGALAVGGYVWYGWAQTGQELVPQLALEAQGQQLAPVSYVWNAALAGGYLYKTISSQESSPATDVGIVRAADYMTPPHLELRIPDGWQPVFYLAQGGGAEQRLPAGWDDAYIAQQGSYALRIVCETAKQAMASYGSAEYRLEFAVEIPEPPTPELLLGRTNLAQGEIFSMKMLNLPEGIVPTAQTELGMSRFVPQGEAWLGIVPVGNRTEPGGYFVRVQAGELSWDVALQVEEYDFDLQNLIIDTSNPTISEASSPAAYQEFRDKIYPLYETADDAVYWEGLFSWPCQGRISTEFGELRYTNGDWSTLRSHNGMDIACAEGTPVQAPNAGRVVFAEYLLNTGNTLVIEHGGGLKSYYYHLVRLDVEAGQMVAQGDVVAAVGSTGYSTGPHLHYEMRIGDKAVSPSMLFDSGAGLYSADAEQQEGQAA